MKGIYFFEKVVRFGKRDCIAVAATMLMGCGLCTGEETKQIDPAEAERSEKESIAAIEKIGGKVKLKPSLSVDFLGTKVTDVGLVHLKELTGLQSLFLNDTKITDTGLLLLKELTGLGSLSLNDTNVTGAGLVHLKGLAKTSYLYLADTQITDAGLEQLKGLTKMGFLDLSKTQVTDAGASLLQSALPDCKISR